MTFHQLRLHQYITLYCHLLLVVRYFYKVTTGVLHANDSKIGKPNPSYLVGKNVCGSIIYRY